MEPHLPAIPAYPFDHIVIGAGSAGCVLAARLSERSANRVLLIEAGTDYLPGTEPPEILDIFAATAYADPRFTWPGLTAKFEPRPEPRMPIFDRSAMRRIP